MPRFFILKFESDNQAFSHQTLALTDEMEQEARTLASKLKADSNKPELAPKLRARVIRFGIIDQDMKEEDLTEYWPEE